MERLKLPPLSPDLNGPAENLVAHMQQTVANKYSVTYPTRQQVIDTVMTEVDRINENPVLLRNLILSYRKRLQNVKANNYDRTRVGTCNSY